jgi:hypothetical protein
MSEQKNKEILEYLEDIEVLYSNYAKRRYWCHDTWVPAGYSVAIIPNELVEKILEPKKSDERPSQS